MNNKYSAIVGYTIGEFTRVICAEHWFDGTNNLKEYAIGYACRLGCILSKDTIQRLQGVELPIPESRLVEIAAILTDEGIPVRVNCHDGQIHFRNTADTRTYSCPISFDEALKYFEDAGIHEHELHIMISNENDFLTFIGFLSECIKIDDSHYTFEADRLLSFADEVEAGSYSFEKESGRLTIQATW